MNAEEEVAFITDNLRVAVGHQMTRMHSMLLAMANGVSVGEAEFADLENGYLQRLLEKQTEGISRGE
jgi:hypothetical protein